ncbi:hypothetical protein B0H11DRAFT_2276615, partial [Mycena galericulata]
MFSGKVLLAFLLQPAPENVDVATAVPPALPQNLQNLPPQSYIDAALDYLDAYPFTRTFTIYTPVKRKEKNLVPNHEWRTKSRAVLRACILVDRSDLASLNPGATPYDASKQQLAFVHEHIIKRRWALEEVASEMRALLQLVRSVPRPASAVSTPSDTGLPREKTVEDQVHDRDVNCRLTGVGAPKEGDEQDEENAPDVVMVPELQVAHCLPYKMRDTTYALLTGLTGIEYKGWVTDSVQNAFLARPILYTLFAAFKIWFEWVQTANGKEIIIRGRTGLGSPKSSLRGILTDAGLVGETILNQPLRACHNLSIPDIDQRYFVLHKYIGDVVWMSGGAEPVSDEEEDAEMLLDTNFD